MFQESIRNWWTYALESVQTLKWSATKHNFGWNSVYCHTSASTGTKLVDIGSTQLFTVIDILVLFMIKSQVKTLLMVSQLYNKKECLFIYGENYSCFFIITTVFIS